MDALIVVDDRSLERKINSMINDLVLIRQDANAFERKGNKSAGTRVTKGLQQIKKKATEVRNMVFQIKNQEESK